jgi:hypothetical protein
VRQEQAQLVGIDQAAPSSPNALSVQAAGAAAPILAPFSYYETWRVSGGYREGPCHNDTGCGDPYKETLAFDLVPTSGSPVGRTVYSPGPGTVTYRRTSIGTGRGGSVGIRLDADGSYVFIDHIDPVAFTEGQSRVGYHTPIGRVSNTTAFPPHIHIQQNRADYSALPMTINGRYYSPDQSWSGTQIQYNYIAEHTNFGGRTLVMIGTGLVNDLRSYSWNDLASSVRVNPGCSSTLWEHINRGGAAFTRWSTDSTLVDDGWNDRASAWAVTC